MVKLFSRFPWHLAPAAALALALGLLAPAALAAPAGVPAPAASATVATLAAPPARRAARPVPTPPPPQVRVEARILEWQANDSLDFDFAVQYSRTPG
jgi:hypothetical protein